MWPCRSSTKRPAPLAVTDHVLRADATATDFDQDTITGLEYCWLRGGVEVGTARTDPASGTTTMIVDIVGNTAPTVVVGSITGYFVMGATLTSHSSTATRMESRLRP